MEKSTKQQLFVAFLVVALAYAVTADWDDYDDRPCVTDVECSRSDCCVEDPRSADGRKSCQDEGDDVGEPCGGPHFCGCQGPRYICIPFAAPPVRRLRGYYHLANGTCQRDPAFFTAAGGAGGRPDRRRDDSDSDENDSDWDDRR